MFSGYLLATHEIGVEIFQMIFRTLSNVILIQIFHVLALHHDLLIVACIYEVSLSRVEKKKNS